LLGVGQPGQWAIGALGQDLDLRTDLPGYCVYREGHLAGTVSSLEDLWQDDFVAFAIGCSFSFEQMLMDSGIRLRHIEQGRNVAMFRTRTPTVPAGPFAGELVVSMRPLAGGDIDQAIRITGGFPAIHGAPVQVGDPAALGIADLQRPDFGDPVAVLPGEQPVFWACGVTSQVALGHARLPLAITHRPGHMLVTDLLNATLAGLTSPAAAGTAGGRSSHAT
jgi:uncharacterized protein YcsI (UPF0317 family)